MNRLPVKSGQTKEEQCLVLMSSLEFSLKTQEDFSGLNVTVMNLQCGFTLALLNQSARYLLKESITCEVCSRNDIETQHAKAKVSFSLTHNPKPTDIEFKQLKQEKSQCNLFLFLLYLITLMFCEMMIGFFQIDLQLLATKRG